MKLDLAKELHFRELDRRMQLDNAVTLRVAILTALGGLFSYFARTYKLISGIEALALVILISLCALCIVAAILFLVRCYVGYEWQYIAYPTDLLASHRALCAYHEEHGLELEPDEVFEMQVRDRFAEAATFNMAQNNQRFEFLDTANKFVAVAVTLAVFTGVVMVIEYIQTGAL